jgi:hypothetical protein
MRVSCTLKDGIVYLPSIVKTEAGFYMLREPVAVVPAANTDALWRAFQEMMDKDTEIVPTPKRNAYPPPVLPKYADAKNWSAFMKGAAVWWISEENGIYEIIPYRKDPKGGKAWVEDKDRKTQFPAGTTRDQVIEQLIKIVQAAAKSK